MTAKKWTDGRGCLPHLDNAFLRLSSCNGQRVSQRLSWALQGRVHGCSLWGLLAFVLYARPQGHNPVMGLPQRRLQGETGAPRQEDALVLVLRQVQTRAEEQSRAEEQEEGRRGPKEGWGGSSGLRRWGLAAGSGVRTTRQTCWGVNKRED